jgi:serine protease Do
MKFQQIVMVATMAGSLLVPVVAAQAPPPPPPVPPGAQVQGRVLSSANGSSFLGVGIQEIDAERAKALKLKEEAGVEVTRVDADSPAEKAGVKPGDVITEYQGQRVEGIDQFSRMVRETPAGRDVKIRLIRNGNNQTITVRVGSRPSGLFSDGFGNIPQPGDFRLRIPDVPRPYIGWRSSMLGVEAEALDGQLAEYFGVKQGVLVRSIVKDSAAEKAGIKAGDVIVRVDGNAVSTPSDLSSRIRVLRGKSASVVLMREHKETTVTVMISDDRRGDTERRRRAGSSVEGGLEVL